MSKNGGQEVLAKTDFLDFFEKRFLHAQMDDFEKLSKIGQNS